MANLDRTTERMLREYERAGAIRAAKILKTSGGYVLVVRVDWHDGDLVVFSERGKPRDWVSLDRLLRYLSETIPSVTHFDLRLDEPLSAASETKVARQAPHPGTRRTIPTQAKQPSSVVRRRAPGGAPAAASPGKRTRT